MLKPIRGTIKGLDKKQKKEAIKQDAENQQLWLSQVKLTRKEWTDVSCSPFFAWFEREFEVPFLAARKKDLSDIKMRLGEPHVGDQGLGLLLTDVQQAHRMGGDQKWRDASIFLLRFTRALGLWEELWNRDPKVFEAYCENISILATQCGESKLLTLIPMSYVIA